MSRSGITPRSLMKFPSTGFRPLFKGHKSPSISSGSVSFHRNFQIRLSLFIRWGRRQNRKTQTLLKKWRQNRKVQTKTGGARGGEILWTVFLLSLLRPAFAESAESRTVFDTPFSHIVYGGAGAASLKPDLSYLINPSLLAWMGGQGVAAYSVKSYLQTALLSVTDKHAMIPAGVTFQREWDSRKKYAPVHRWSLSVGSQIISSFSLGAVVHRETEKNKDTRWNGGVGALLRLGRRTALGVTLSDILIYESKNRRVLRFGLYRKWARLLSGRVDMSYSVKNRWVIRGGAETLINRFIALRGGGLWSFKEKKALFSGGGGFYGPRLQVDYALQKDSAVFHHVLTARLFF